MFIGFKNARTERRIPVDRAFRVIGKALFLLSKWKPEYWEAVGETVVTAVSPAYLEIQLFRAPFSLQNAEDSLVALHHALLAKSADGKVTEAVFYIRAGTSNVAKGQLRWRSSKSLTPPIQSSPDVLRL